MYHKYVLPIDLLYFFSNFVILGFTGIKEDSEKGVLSKLHFYWGNDINEVLSAIWTQGSRTGSFIVWSIILSVQPKLFSPVFLVKNTDFSFGHFCSIWVIQSWDKASDVPTREITSRDSTFPCSNNEAKTFFTFFDGRTVVKE